MRRRKIPAGYENDERPGRGRGWPQGSVHRSGLSRELDFCQVARGKGGSKQAGEAGDTVKGKNLFFIPLVSFSALLFPLASLGFCSRCRGFADETHVC